MLLATVLCLITILLGVQQSRLVLQLHKSCPMVFYNTPWAGVQPYTLENRSKAD